MVMGLGRQQATKANYRVCFSRAFGLEAFTPLKKRSQLYGGH
jgi:hypothetical protein